MIENTDERRHGWRLSPPEEGDVISQSIRTVALTAFLLSIPSYVSTAQNQPPSRGRKNRVSISWTHDVVTWERKTDGLDEGLRPADRRDESGIGDDNVMIYPVRTELSRYLTGADLYVDLRASAARDEERGKTAVKTIRRNVPGLEIEHKGTINFRLHLPAGANGVDDLAIQRELQTFAKALGFEKSSLTIGG